MSMRGELGTFSVAEILQLIGSQEKSGVLQIRSKGRAAVLFFDSGKINSARDRRQATNDPFLTYLLENGEITIQDLHRVIEAKKNEGGDTVEVMLREKLVDDDKIGEMLSRYALQIVTNIVKWETGTYEFSASCDGMPDKALGKPLRLEPILMEALRRKDEVEEIRRFLPGLDARLDIAEPNYESLPLEEDDLAVLRLVDGARTIDQIIEESAVDEVETLDILEKLFALGIISICAESAEPSQSRRISPRKSMALVAAALLASLVLRLGVTSPGGAETRSQARLTAAVNQLTEARELDNLGLALDAYRAANGSYPDNLQQLVSARLASPDAIRDSAGRVYAYTREAPGDSFKLSP
ncbi:MAG: DUF4388 domain-containing protein [bacterium]